MAQTDIHAWVQRAQESVFSALGAVVECCSCRRSLPYMFNPGMVPQGHEGYFRGRRLFLGGRKFNLCIFLFMYRMLFQSLECLTFGDQWDSEHVGLQAVTRTTSSALSLVTTCDGCKVLQITYFSSLVF